MRLLALAVLLSALAPAAGRAADAVATPGADAPADDRLVFDYPCSFHYRNGKDYESRVMDFECDYIHASVKGGAKTFDSLPTLAAQKSMLADAISGADAAHTKYMSALSDAVKAADPTRIPKTLSASARIEKLRAMDVAMTTASLAAADPFLWPSRAESSYVESTPGLWPKSWRPYLKPMYDRSEEIWSLIESERSTLIDKERRALDRRLRAVGPGPAADKLKTVAGPEALDKMFDGGVGKGAVTAAPPDPGSHPGPDTDTRRGPGLGPSPLPDLKVAPPPIPEDSKSRGERNYFSRGTAAALTRLKDDANLAVAHSRGTSRTVGAPYEKAPLIIHQEGPSCAVAAQYEAMSARGLPVKVADLAVEGRDKGYYVDYALYGNGRRVGGTNDRNLDALLKDHGVKTALNEDATQADLDRAIRTSGDAIVAVRTREFWNDPTQGPNESHAVYVTGEEVSSDGKTVLGYYFNDTGTGEAARYVPAAVFLKAWRHKLVVLDAPR